MTTLTHVLKNRIMTMLSQSN